MNVTTAIEQRWSPREYTAEPIGATQLRLIFEAARWAHSCFNEQPWRYLITTKESGPVREQVESYLATANAYAKNAWVLGITFAHTRFARNDRPNRHAWHDLGAASQLISLKAFEMGWQSRFMGGFDHERARELCPPDYDPVAMFVIGRATTKALQAGPGDRARRPVEQYVFEGSWDKPFNP